MVYPEKIAKRLSRLRAPSVSPQGNAAGAEANFTCGSFVRFKLSINDETATVVAATISSNGCGYMLAAADILVGEVENKSLGELHGLATDDLYSLIEKELGNPPTDRRECVAATIAALRSAFADYRSRRLEEFRGEKPLICTCFGVTEERIETLIADKSLTTVDEVSHQTNAGTGCGSCRMLIQELIDSREDV